MFPQTKEPWYQPDGDDQPKQKKGLHWRWPLSAFRPRTVRYAVGASETRLSSVSPNIPDYENVLLRRSGVLIVVVMPPLPVCLSIVFVALFHST